MNQALKRGLAKLLLGADFITPEEITKARPSIIYTDEQITALAESLPSWGVLKWCRKNGYVVMPAPPTAMSMVEIRDIEPAQFYRETGRWCANYKFAREDKTSFGWLSIQKIPISGSIGWAWNEQNELLSEFERVPNAAEISWFITTYFKVRGVRLLKDVYVWTSSLFSDYEHILVGEFTSEGLGVNPWKDAGSIHCLGLSSARKL